jgi:hypothetical protein
LRPRFDVWLIGSAQHTTEYPHGSEDDYFHLLERTMAVSPWIEYWDKNLPSVPDRNIATAAEFAHKLAEAVNFTFPKVREVLRRDITQHPSFLVRRGGLAWMSRCRASMRLMEYLPAAD